MEKRKPQDPAIPTDLPVSPRQELEDRDEFRSCRIDQLDWARRIARRVQFDVVRVTKVSLAEARLDGLDWVDVCCSNSDLARAVCEDSAFTRVHFENCRLTGAQFAGCRFEDVRFTDCQLGYLNGSSSKFRRVSFERCAMVESIWQGADLTGTSFRNCDLSGADFENAKLASADISSSNSHRIRIGPAQARGLTINREQAIAFAELLGLNVVDG